MKLQVRTRAAAMVTALAAAALAGGAATPAATAQSSLGPLNRAPVAADGTATILFGTPTESTLTAVDPDGDALTFAIVTPPAHGMLGAVVGNRVTYTPDRDYLGADAFTFKATDGALDSNVATFALSVVYPNHAPLAEPGAAVTDEDAPVELTLAASDPDADALALAIVTPPAHGTLGPIADDKVTYTPTARYRGPDSFVFKASDDSLDSNLATFVLTVGPANHAPVASDVSTTTAGGAPKQVTLRRRTATATS